MGGSIHDPKGNKIVHYAWGLGNVTDNLFEAYLLWCTLNITRKYGIMTLYVFGNSMLIIQEVII